MVKKAQEKNNESFSPPFINGPEEPRKELKREDFPNLSDEDFEWFQKINKIPGEGPRIG